MIRDEIAVGVWPKVNIGGVHPFNCVDDTYIYYTSVPSRILSYIKFCTLNSADKSKRRYNLRARARVGSLRLRGGFSSVLIVYCLSMIHVFIGDLEL